MKYGTNINTFINTIQKKDALFATDYATKHLKLNSKKITYSKVVKKLLYLFQ